LNRFTIGGAEVLRVEETMVHFDGREFFPELTDAMLDQLVRGQEDRRETREAHRAPRGAWIWPPLRR
jgi:hypothetical protein